MAKVLVFGGSGVIGRGVLEAAAADPRVSEVVALQRRPVEPPIERVRTVSVQDFGDLSPVAAEFRGAKAVVFALGISQTQVSGEAEYVRITVDFALEAARMLARESPGATFVYVSGGGADSTEKSRILFARVKGRAENLLRKEPGLRVVLARPGGVFPERWPRPPKFSERVFSVVLRPFVDVWRSSLVRQTLLGRALLECVFREGPLADPLENADLRALVEPR